MNTPILNMLHFFILIKAKSFASILNFISNNSDFFYIWALKLPLGLKSRPVTYNKPGTYVLFERENPKA